MTAGGLLAVFAHPDDETFGVGGTMARYAAHGLPVTMVCATRGEVGEISSGSEATPDTLGQFREQELREAMAILGVKDVRFLGFRDSGMKGTPENEDPRAFANAHPAAVVHMLVRTIREVQPRAIITWDEAGGYGHPDHVAIHHHATAAFHAAADASTFPTTGAPFSPAGLFYLAIPFEEFGRAMQTMRERGLDVPDVGDTGIDELPHAVPNVRIDVQGFLETKEQAMRTHRTQIGDVEGFLHLPDDIRRQFFGIEHFFRAAPPVAVGTMLSDLFE